MWLQTEGKQKRLHNSLTVNLRKPIFNIYSYIFIQTQTEKAFKKLSGFNVLRWDMPLLVCKSKSFKGSVDFVQLLSF